MSNKKFDNEEKDVARKDISQGEVSKKEFKKKPFIIGLVTLVILALGIVGFALTNNGNGNENIPEILEYEEEIVEAEEVPEEMELNTDVNFNFLVDEGVANNVLNVMSLTLLEREDTDKYYEFNVDDLLEGIIVDAEDISDGTYYITSFRLPVTKDAELLVLNNLLQYDIEVIDGVPDLVGKPEITCCIDSHICEEYYCADGECAVECLVEREYNKELMYFNEDEEMVVHLPLIVVPVEEQTDEELIYVINEVSTWLDNNPDVDQELIDRIQNALENAKEELEYRFEGEDLAVEVNDDGELVVINPEGEVVPPVNQPPSNDPPTGGNQGGGGTNPPANPPNDSPNQPTQCNHNWVEGTTTINHPAIPGTPIWMHHCHNCNFSTSCGDAMWAHVEGFTCTDNFGGFWSEQTGYTGGSPAWTETVGNGIFTCSLCGVRR